jgi:RNA polymerase sigma factor for flagellar operon FliA
MFESMNAASVSLAHAAGSSEDSSLARSTTANIPPELAARFVPIIRRLARCFAQRLPSHISIDDLIGAGAVALVEHYRRNGALAGEDFERAAVARIRGAMLDELRGADPLTRRMRQRERQIAQAGRKLEASLGRWPTHVEIADHLKITPEAYSAAIRVSHASQVTTFDEAEIADREAIGPEERLSKTERLERLRGALGNLPPRLKQVLELHFGEGLTLRQIGGMLGVTEARISQLVGDAVKRLKVTCRSVPPPPLPGC